MTEQQFNVLANLLGYTAAEQAATHRIIIGGKTGDAVATQHADRLRQIDASIREVYVVHSPMEFRITVGHRDTHRMPGALKIKVGDIVRLIGHSTERWIPVRVTALPNTAADYYSGVITEQLVKLSKFQVGNGVRFSEDQVFIEAPRAASRRRRSN